MKYLKAAFTGLVLMVSGLANATLINYDLVLTADSDYTAFGGGLAGDQFFGTFSIDDSLLSGTYFAQDDGFELTGSLLFMSIDIAGTIFSDATTTIHSNALHIVGGALADISFLLINSNSDMFSVLTNQRFGRSSWFAIEYAANSDVVEGDTFGFSVKYSIADDSADAEVPEPSTLAIFALGLLGLASHRLRKS